MKSLKNDKIYQTILMYKHLFLVLYAPTDETKYSRVTEKYNFKLDKNQIFFDITGCPFDINLQTEFDTVFEEDNIGNKAFTNVILRKVYAMGYIEIDNAPANWNTLGVIEFPEGIPEIVLNFKKISVIISQNCTFQEESFGIN